MICSKCKAEMADDALFCPVCGEAVSPATSAEPVAEAVEAAEAAETVEVTEAEPVAEVAEAEVAEVAEEKAEAPAVEKKKKEKSVASVLSGPCGIVTASLLGLWVIFGFLSFIGAIVQIADYDVFVPLLSWLIFTLTPIIFAIIATVAIVKMVAKKKAEPKMLAPLPKFFGVMRGFAVAKFVLACIVCGLIHFVLIFLGALVGAVSAELDDIGDAIGGNVGDMFEELEFLFDIGAFGILFLGSIIIAGIIVYFVHMVKLHAAIRDYYNRVIDVQNGAPYNPLKKAPYVRIFVLSGINLSYNFFALSVAEVPISILAGLFLNAFLIATGVQFILVERAIIASGVPMGEPKTAPIAAPIAAPAAAPAPEATPVAPAAPAATATATAQPTFTQEQMMQMMQMMMQMQQAQQAAKAAEEAPKSDSADEK